MGVRQCPQGAIGEGVTWIERTHHRRRRQTGLGLTPIEYEAIVTTPANQTA
ncbi:transposase [Mycolicibacterium vaccae ATCC 25954]|uniref:Transposase n=1 Tax=Mycolicibacterium vaccae ATCC 25954 TaxID=1194972 RepID=K0V4L6_MYCVA|nr:transposase [Mycolicibacterium vaccae 95051]EJZ05984.1 transposase [Mycolicibacterium vaccae ATCC 25954]